MTTRLNLNVGISWCSSKGGWRLRRYIGDKVIRLARFKTRIAARKANLRLMQEHPYLVRYMKSPMGQCCKDAPTCTTVCKYHSDRLLRRGFRFMPNNTRVKMSGRVPGGRRAA